MLSCNAFDTHRHQQTDDALHKHNLCPWQMHIVLWKQTMWTETTATYYVFLLRLAWMYVLSMLGSNNNVRKYVYPMWTPTDRTVQSQSNDRLIQKLWKMINSEKKRIKSNLFFSRKSSARWKQIHSLMIYWMACMPLIAIKTVQKIGWSH